MRRTVISLFIALFLVFTGCGEKEQHVAENISQEASLAVCTESVDKSYIMDYKDAQITPDFRPLSTSFCVSGEKLYFVDNQGMTLQSICEVDLSGTEEPLKLPIDLSEVFVEVLAIEADKSGDSTIYCMGRTVAENGFLAAYSMEGELLFQKDFDEDLSKALQNNVVYKLALDAEGNIYALSSACLYLFDKNGEYQGEVECPGKGYCSMEGCGDGVYVTYQNAEGNKTEIAKVQFSYKNLTDAKELLGDGTLWKGQGNTLLTRDSSALYSCDLAQEKVVKLLDFATHDVIGSELQAAVQKESGEPVLVSWKLLNQSKPVELLSFREAKEGEETGDGKQEITVLSISPFMEEMFGDIVVDFNKQSKDYKVVFETIEFTGNKMADIYACTNTRLMAKESADLLYMFDYKEMEIYQSQGFLEEITPYIEKSEKLDMEQLDERILKCLELDGKLYGMSEALSITTMLGRRSELGEYTGWTVEEMLAWLKEHPNTKAEQGLSKEYILEMILKGDLSSYIEGKSRKADFEGEEFSTLLSSINNLQVDTTFYYDDPDGFYDTDNAVLTEQHMASFSELTGWRDEQYGDKLVYRGYPTATGEPKYIVSMNAISILSKSKCKEGAYAFIEYMLTRNDSSGGFSTYKVGYEERREDFLETYATDELDKEELEKRVAALEEMMDSAVADTMEYQTIRTMVVEEAQAYFAGDKTLEDTCRIIQSRVQLYLDENEKQ